MAQVDAVYALARNMTSSGIPSPCQASSTTIAGRPMSGFASSETGPVHFQPTVGDPAARLCQRQSVALAANISAAKTRPRPGRILRHHENPLRPAITCLRLRRSQ